MNIFTLWLSCKPCVLSPPCRLVAVVGISPGMGDIPALLCPCGCCALVYTLWVWDHSQHSTAQTLLCELVKENGMSYRNTFMDPLFRSSVRTEESLQFKCNLPLRVVLSGILWSFCIAHSPRPAAQPEAAPCSPVAPWHVKCQELYLPRVLWKRRTESNCRLCCLLSIPATSTREQTATAQAHSPALHSLINHIAQENILA